MTEARAHPDPEAVRRQNELFDLYANWPGDDDPDDDPEFVAAAREIMGLPPLPGSLDGSTEPAENVSGGERAAIDAAAVRRRTLELHGLI